MLHVKVRFMTSTHQVKKQVPGAALLAPAFSLDVSMFRKIRRIVAKDEASFES